MEIVDTGTTLVIVAEDNEDRADLQGTLEAAHRHTPEDDINRICVDAVLDRAELRERVQRGVNTLYG